MVLYQCLCAILNVAHDLVLLVEFEVLKKFVEFLV